MGGYSCEYPAELRRIGGFAAGLGEKTGVWRERISGGAYCELTADQVENVKRLIVEAGCFLSPQLQSVQMDLPGPICGAALADPEAADQEGSSVVVHARTTTIVCLRASYRRAAVLLTANNCSPAKPWSGTNWPEVSCVVMWGRSTIAPPRNLLALQSLLHSKLVLPAAYDAVLR